MKKILIITAIFLFFDAFAQSIEENINKGNNYYSIGQYELAEKLYRDALEDDPENRIAQDNLANALYLQKNTKRTRKCCMALLRNQKKIL